MPISLRNETPHIDLDLDLNGELIQALAAAMERSNRLHGADAYPRKLAAALAEAVSRTLPSELQPPSPAQMSYAVSISKRLGVDIPKDATLFRGAMHEFTSAYASLLDPDGDGSRNKKVGEASSASGAVPQSPMQRARLRYKQSKP